MLGECELAMASGRARLDRVGALQANIARGEVAVGSIAGPAVITGSAVAARIGRAAAGLELSSVSGSLDIDRCDGAVTASTGDTAIRIGRLTHGRAELTNRSGNIEIGVSAGTAARVDASSERASVRNTAPSPDDPGPFDHRDRGPRPLALRRHHHCAGRKLTGPDQEPSVPATSSDQFVCVPSRVASANFASPRRRRAARSIRAASGCE